MEHTGFCGSVRQEHQPRNDVDGRSKKQIADALFVSYHTVDMRMKIINLKVQVRPRTGAVAKTLKERAH